ncbi:MAG: GNAT family N-acetyltransferase [Terriglobales bacterium]
MRVDDLDRLATIYVRAIESANVGEHWTVEAAGALLSHWLERQSDLAFVALAEQELIGAFVVGVRPWWDGNHLVDGEFFVAPEHQNKGAGRALMRAVILAAKHKYAPVSFESYTFRAHEYPLDWYKRLGFSEIDEWVMIRAEFETLAGNLS